MRHFPFQFLKKMALEGLKFDICKFEIIPAVSVLP